jgi:cyclopropane-fatty-acyl-phospholipid synthase
VGSLNVRMPGRREIVFGDAQATPQAAMRVTDYRAFRRIATGGDVGLGEAYTAGEWDTDDLPGLIQRLIENWHMVDEDARAVRIGRWLGRLGHLRRGNTLRGSRRNISEHYDLGNDFFRLWLDPGMSYSSALYEGDPQRPLQEAQEAKNRRILSKLQATPGQRVLEIGCGWGGFAELAARDGLAVHGITLSPSQLAYAGERMARAGLDGRARFSLTDYRDLAGRYDHIVSVEMFEAVGHAFLAPFFAVCDRVLKPGGALVLQAITIPHERYEDYRNSVDWIRKHIFPGGHLPSVEILRAAMAQSTRLELVDAEDIAPHYARTLRDWRGRFEAAREPLATMGFDQAFCRKWVYYFALCEASFQTRKLGLHHLVIKRAGESG